MTTTNTNLIHVDVMFRIFKGECIAVFPHLLSASYKALSFTLLDGHNDIDYSMLIKNSRPALECEYEKTFALLVSLGYVLTLVKRRKKINL